RRGKRLARRRLLGPRGAAAEPGQGPGEREDQRQDDRAHDAVGDRRQGRRDAALLLALEDLLLLDEGTAEAWRRRYALHGDRAVLRQVDRRAEQGALAVQADERLPAAVNRDRPGGPVAPRACAVEAVEHHAVPLPGQHLDPVRVVDGRGRRYP